jgi:hypothetical protein
MLNLDFGMAMVGAMVEKQRGGWIERSWLDDRLIVDITIPSPS